MRLDTSFNGAVPFQARKYGMDLSNQNATEASMGPCLFRHGNDFNMFL